jgi:tetratricopeptide (TPR) repeat protein
MYLHGSKWSMLHRRKPISIWRILILVILIGAFSYINFFIVPVTAPLFVPTATPTRAPETYIADADALAKEGKYNQAIEMYNKAIQSDPSNVNTFLSLARAQIFNQNFKDAQISAENALMLNNNNPTAHALRGEALSLQGDYLTAESAITHAIELDANNALAHGYYAELLILQNEAGQGSLDTITKASSESNLAIALAPDTMDAHRARGIVYLNTNNLDLAIQEFQSAIAISPNIADLHLSLGLAFRQEATPELDKAVEQFTIANGLNPSDPLPNTYIARTYANIGEYAKAAQYAEQAVKIAPSDPTMWGTLGTMQYKLLKYQDAVASLRLAVRGGTTPDGVAVKGLTLDYGRVVEFYYIYALTLARLGDCNEAVQVSQLLLQGAKDDETAVYNANYAITLCTTGGPVGTGTPQAGDNTPPAGDSIPSEAASTETPAQ